MADVGVADLQRAVLELQRQIRALSDVNKYMVRAHFAFRERHADLWEEHHVLCECLHLAGLLRPADLLARMQAHRLSRAFVRLLDEPGVARTIVQGAGDVTVCRLCAASRFCLESVSSALYEVAAGQRWASALLRAMESLHQEDDAPRGGRAAPGAQAPAAPRPAHSPGSLKARPQLTSGRQRSWAMPARAKPSPRPLDSRNSPSSWPQEPAGGQPECCPHCGDVPQDLSSETRDSDYAGNGYSDSQTQEISSEGLSSGNLERCPHCNDGRVGGQLRELSCAEPECCPHCGDDERGEQLQELSSAAPECCPYFSDSDPEAVLAPGQAVQVQGLQRRQELNGLAGSVVSRAPCGTRWNVLLSTGECIRTASANLRLLGAGGGRVAEARRLRPALRWGWAREAQATAPWTTVLLPMGRLLSTARLAGAAGVQALETASMALFKAVKSEGQVYVLGGSNGSGALNSAERLDPASGRWEELPPMLQRRDAACAAAVGTYVYACGGCDGGAAMNSVERFSPITGAWEVVPPMGAKRSFATCSVVLGLIYVCGGGCSSGATLSSVERFSPSLRSWQTVQPMSQARCSAISLALARRLYVCGGAEQQALSSSECFNPATGAWRPLPPMRACRYFAAWALLGNCLYVCGGTDGKRPLRAAERLRVGSDHWEGLPPMLQDRCGAVAAAASTGRIYVCGGCTAGPCGELSSVETFDLTSWTWERAESMSERRAFPLAVAISGHLYVLGGSFAQKAVGSLERLDLAMGTWKRLPSMASARMGATVASIAL